MPTRQGHVKLGTGFLLSQDIAVYLLLCTVNPCLLIISIPAYSIAAWA